ncbi:MAG: hypothetical protein HUU55_19435 [Myxococcales bacterium]|nr:hypothetical protein [Myxococcales bacterium]
MTEKSNDNNRANQLNPTHPAYHQSRGVSADEAQRLAGQSKPVLDNRSNQLNPNSSTYHSSRGQGSKS